VINVRHAAATAELARLFDLRTTSPTPEPSARAWTPGDLDDRRLIGHPEADPVFVEQYRRVAAALHHAQVQEGIRGVLVASAVAAEGKTLSATNLALVLSRFEKRVLLVDGDLRKPSVHRLLAIENSTGLSDILKRPGGRFTAQILSPTLSVITGGPPDPDPVALLVSDAAGQFIAQAREHFDWVVVDTPPIMLFPDAGVFADRLDTCVLVVSAATTASPVAVTAMEAVGASRILGVVLNRAEPSEIAAGYDYGQYRTPGDDGPRGRFAFWRSRRI
jgi:capsular exopolysaccharide synthesis family protein